MSTAEWDVPDESDDSAPPVETKEMREARNQVKKLEAALKAAEARATKAEVFMAEYQTSQRQSQAEAAFASLNLPTGLSKAFLAMNPDAEINEEAVSLYATDLGLQPSAPETTNERSAPPEPQQQAGTGPPQQVWHNPDAVGTSSANAPKMTMKELDTLVRENPLAARKALAEGRVDLDVVEAAPGTWGMRTKGT